MACASTARAVSVATDVTEHEGIPVTTVPGRSSTWRTPGRRGAKLLSAAESQPEMTRSVLESRFLAIVDRLGLPRPNVNAYIEGYDVDFAWPDAKLIVETDGFAAHSTRRAFEDDRLLDRRLGRAGYRTIRLTARSLAYEAEIVADLEAILPPTRSCTSSASAR
jgi:very-short-patch-repair endonuclease